MQKPSQLVTCLVVLALMPTSVLADDLGSGFGRARDIIRDWKPSSSSGDRAREEREDRSVGTVPNTPSPADIARQMEQQRIQNNLASLSAALASVANRPRATQPSSPFTFENDPPATILARKQQLDVLLRAGDGLAAQRLVAADKDKARQDAAQVREALQRGAKPPFQSLWSLYQYNRPIAFGLVPSTNKCAIVLSMTLGLAPRERETSLQSLGNKELVATLVGPVKTLLVAPVKDAEIASRLYVRAQDLADRLKSDFGPPVYLEGKDARRFLAGKQGIVFFKNADLRYRLRPRSGDHIDLWNSDRMASSAGTQFENAEKVWFWPIASP